MSYARFQIRVLIAGMNAETFFSLETLGFIQSLESKEDTITQFPYKNIYGFKKNSF